MIIPTSDISLSALKDLFYSSESLELSDVAIQQIQKARTYLDSFSGTNGAPVYGVNTGFGSLCNTIIPDHDMSQLQRNLLISHACGMGNEVPAEIVRLMLLLKVLGLSKGFSGVQLETVQLLLDLYNNKMTPETTRNKNTKKIQFYRP